MLLFKLRAKLWEIGEKVAPTIARRIPAFLKAMFDFDWWCDVDGLFVVLCPCIICFVLHICLKLCHPICCFSVANSIQLLDNKKCEWANIGWIMVHGGMKWMMKSKVCSTTSLLINMWYSFFILTSISFLGHWSFTNESC